MKVKKGIISLCCAVLLTVPLSYASAKENSSLTLIDTKSYEVEGEAFDVQTWLDEYGNKTFTIPSEVKNKELVSEYVDNLLEKEPTISTFGTKYDWSRSGVNELNAFAPNSSSAKITWATNGYSELAYLYPITTNVLKVDSGSLKTSWLGTGNADKIVLSYKYRFNGVTLSISWPFAVTPNSDTVTWTSLPQTGTWYLNTTSESATAESRTSITSVLLTASSDIYKGSNIYRPKVESKVSFLGK
ncbi:hypothetical protein [Paenibacillus sp. W2I17]|uniref:hypothetical protein n=1 Tax=Paenibacillus sp. W2I17 TaxID=3042311 RepID=UPI0027824911|nr:hypothetical protein [Paenibacillus sp. W2I17]MDQ0659680.1 hypothetical protein [Paenibacillus sp. W2I17]